jgi:hypothetical protein
MRGFTASMSLSQPNPESQRWPLVQQGWLSPPQVLHLPVVGLQPRSQKRELGDPPGQVTSFEPSHPALQLGTQVPPALQVPRLLSQVLPSATSQAPVPVLQRRHTPQVWQHWELGTQLLPQTRELGRSPQAPPWHCRQPPVHPGPGWPSVALAQRLPWQLLQGPQSASPQHEPAPAGTQRPEQSRVPIGHSPAHGSLVPTQAIPQRRPPGQSNSHWLLRQARVAPVGPGQRSQRSPQESTLLLSLHTPRQSWKPARQVYTQAPAAHLTSALSRGLQAVHMLQKLTSFSGTQVPLQSFWPVGHIPAQAMALGMQAPAQGLVSGGHSVPHWPATQVALPSLGAGQGVHEPPQLPGLVSGRQLSLQWWNPGLHSSLHLSPSQLATPLGEEGQVAQLEPQVLRLLAATQIPLHEFFPIGQGVLQAALSGTQPSEQTLLPAGQDAPHRMPSQVAVPPLTSGQASQPRPQVRGDMLLAQPSLHGCVPGAQPPSLSGATTVTAGPSLLEGPSGDLVVPPAPGRLATGPMSRASTHEAPITQIANTARSFALLFAINVLHL